MRLFSILSAVVAMALIYGFVMQRDALRALAGAPQQASAQTEAIPETPAPPPATSVVVLRSEARPIDSDIVLRGRTEAARRVVSQAELSGRVISEPLQSGATIEAGDLLCRIDPGTRPAVLAEARARLLEAEANERASATLAERGFGAETTAISNRAALQSAQAMVDQAEREMDQLDIRAPFGGLLETDTAELGALLQPGSECATIIALDPVKLIGYVPETVVSQVAVGAPVRARLQTGQVVDGEVRFVSRSADPETRTFRVEAEAANADLAIRDGITAEIRVGIESVLGHLVPQSALTLDDAGRLGVRIVAQDMTARFLPVQPIRDDAAGFWVGGLPEEVDIIVVGQDFVIDGDAVSVTRAEQQP